jgi:hypothetical protein
MKMDGLLWIDTVRESDFETWKIKIKLLKTMLH